MDRFTATRTGARTDWQESARRYFLATSRTSNEGEPQQQISVSWTHRLLVAILPTLQLIVMAARGGFWRNGGGVPIDALYGATVGCDRCRARHHCDHGRIIIPASDAEEARMQHTRPFT